MINEVRQALAKKSEKNTHSSFKSKLEDIMGVIIIVIVSTFPGSYEHFRLSLDTLDTLHVLATTLTLGSLSYNCLSFTPRPISLTLSPV